MADEKELKQAQYVFDTMCQVLDSHEWRYQKDEQNLSISCAAQGDDLPMSFEIRLDAERSVVLLLSLLPFIVVEDKRIDFAIAVSVINNLLVDGSFDFDLSDGHLFFRMTNSYLESLLSQEALSFLLFCSASVIDAYNDKFLPLAQGTITLPQFLDSLKKENAD